MLTNNRLFTNKYKLKGKEKIEIQTQEEIKAVQLNIYDNEYICKIF